MTTPLDRRDFVGGGVATLAVPTALPAIGFAVPRARSATLVVGVMGLNGRGTHLARDIARTPDVVVGSLCDVDARTFGKAAKAVAAHQKDAPKRLADFRRILDDRTVDALFIAAPDHWHAPAAVLACAAGKDVYVEKPCSHNPREGELLVAAAQKHGRIVQMGNQRRSWPAVIAAIAAVRAKIGRPYLGRCWYANGRPGTGRRSPAPVPDRLDWKLWQGPAPRVPFATNILHYKWHWYWRWGTGELGNNGVHAVDLARWALDVDFPTRVVSSGGRYHFDDAQVTPDTHTVSWEFAGRKQITWEGISCNRYGVEGSGFGATILGTEGSVTIGAREWVRRDLAGKEVERHAIAGGNASHLDDFFTAVRTRKAPTAEIVGAHRSTLLAHLGNIAHRTGEVLDCDPANGHVRDASVMAAHWSREYEKGFEPRV